MICFLTEPQFLYFLAALMGVAEQLSFCGIANFRQDGVMRFICKLLLLLTRWLTSYRTKYNLIIDSRRLTVILKVGIDFIIRLSCMPTLP